MNIEELSKQAATLRLYSARLRQAVEEEATSQIEHLWDEACAAFEARVRELEVRERSSQEASHIAKRTIEALSEGIVVLDETGIIIGFNKAWRDIANLLHPATQDIRKGTYYLALWNSTPDKYSEEIIEITAGIDAVLKGERVETLHEYLCNSSFGQQWFKVRAKRFYHEGAARLVVVHDDISENKRMEEAIKESEESLARAQQITHIGNWDWNLLTNEVRWSEEIYRIYGTSREAFGKTFDAAMRFTHPDDMEQIMLSIDNILGDHKPSNSTYRIIRPDGTIRVVNGQAKVYFDEANRPIKMVGTVQDITEQWHIEDELRKQKEIFQKIFDHIPLMISFNDEDGRIKLVNQEWERVRGLKQEEVEGQSLDILAKFYPDPQYRQEVREFIAAASGEWADFKSRGSDGSLLETAWAVVPLSDGTRLGIGRDITDRKRAEQERNQLIHRLITAQEDERRRISRELHDQMGQYLAALMMGIESLSGASQLPARAQDDLLYLKNLTEQFEQEVHRFALELRPTTLDDLGLHATLSNCVEDWARRNQNKVSADFRSIGFAEQGQRLSPEIEATLYRVVQEALTNVFKHAKAKNVSVILDRRPDSVRLIIEDDGAGFEVEAPVNVHARDHRLGLTSMLERIELVGGTLKIDSDAGTTIVVNIPL